MGLFSNKDGGVMDAIRCDEVDYLVWKWHPQGTSQNTSQRANSIRWGSSLRVREGSVAIFVHTAKDGTIQDYIEGLFDQVIKTENFPAIATVISGFYNSASPFQAEVYFVNLANLIQIKFGVPYFDIFDPRFLDYGVPVAVRGAINFKISDYREFIKLHRLDNFDMATFQLQVRDAIIRHVKSVVTNAPDNTGIPAVQIERHISEINALVETDLTESLRKDFGVSVTRVDVSDIEVDKTSDGYKKLQSLTQNKANVIAQSAVNIVDTLGTNRVGAKRIKKTKKAEGAATGLASEVGEVGKKVSGAIGSIIGGIKKPKGTPPPLPKNQFYVAINGEQAGPYDLGALKEMVEDGTVTPESLAWKNGMKDWEKAEAIDELKGLFV